MSTVKPFNSGQIFKPLTRSAVFLATEAAEAAKNDPALAMRLAVGGLVSPLLSGVSPDVATVTGNTLVPVVRGALLAMNTMRCVNTFKNPESKGYEKAADLVRVVSDTAGFIGGLAMLFTPQYAALGAKLMGTAYSVDIVSHSFRGLTHAGRRIQFYQTLINDKPENKPPGSDPGPSPGAPPPKAQINPTKPLTQLEPPKQLKLFGN